MLVILLGKMMRKVFFGQLRAAEMEVCLFHSFNVLTIFNICLVHLYIFFKTDLIELWHGGSKFNFQFHETYIYPSPLRISMEII